MSVKKSIDEMGAASLEGDPEILLMALTQVCARLSARIDAALAAPSRNCDKFRDVEVAYEEFMAYVQRENPAYRNPSPLHNVWDALKWAQMPYEGGGKK